jgi:hypothetical protein
MGFFSKPFFEDNLKKWSGKRTLVLSLDVGATHTAVAVALLTKGEDSYRSNCPRLLILHTGRKPTIVAISRWPGQEDRIYEEKVPTVVLYDGNGQVMLDSVFLGLLESEFFVDGHLWRRGIEAPKRGLGRRPGFDFGQEL